MLRNTASKAKLIVNAGRKCHLSSSSSVDNTANYLRNAHASEVFRSAYHHGKHSNTSVSVSDLDEMIVLERTRPSALLGVLDIAGTGLGLIARVTPECVSHTLTTAVEEATIQQFNDSIRSMHGMANDDDGLKDTLKFHRDIRIEDDEETIKKNAAAQASKKDDNPIAQKMTEATTAITTALYHILKTSAKI